MSHIFLKVFELLVAEFNLVKDGRINVDSLEAVFRIPSSRDVRHSALRRELFSSMFVRYLTWLIKYI